MKKIISLLLSVVGFWLVYRYTHRPYLDDIDDVFDTLEGYDFY